jgi:hypothetical protein
MKVGHNVVNQRWTLGAYGFTCLYLVAAPKRWLPACPLRSLFGIYCPACGITRCLREMLAGHLIQAIHDNAIFISSPVFIYVGLILKRKSQSKFIFNVYLFFLVLLVFSFTFFRNQPNSFFQPVE